ncbi:MAG: metal-sulfur cluster assembly factor [Thermoleophilia bacterium]|nr:metal-sulfur cluster assembly factor [Thermoleophilia bacterium]
MATDEEIHSAMKQVEDPELGVNVVDLGLLYGVEQDDEGNVRLKMTLTSMGCPLTEQIMGDAQAVVGPLDGVKSVEVDWVWDPPWTPEKMTEEGRFMMKVMGFG